LEALANESNPFTGPVGFRKTVCRLSNHIVVDPSGLNDPSRVLARQCQAKGYIILITHEPTKILFHCYFDVRKENAIMMQAAKSTYWSYRRVVLRRITFWIMIGDITRNCHECKNVFEAGLLSMRIYIPLNYRFLVRIVQNSNPNFLRTRQRLNECHAALHQSHLPHRRPKHHLR
jgi:hypothetical protein